MGLSLCMLLPHGGDGGLRKARKARKAMAYVGQPNEGRRQHGVWFLPVCPRCQGWLDLNQDVERVAAFRRWYHDKLEKRLPREAVAPLIYRHRNCAKYAGAGGRGVDWCPPLPLD